MCIKHCVRGVCDPQQRPKNLPVTVYSLALD
jgi:hypothetical protein